MSGGGKLLIAIIIIIVLILLIWWLWWANKNKDCDKKPHRHYQKKDKKKETRSPRNESEKSEYMKVCKNLGCKDGRICVPSGFIAVTEENLVPPGWAKIISYDVTADDDKFFILSSEGVYTTDKNYTNLKLHKLRKEYEDGRIYYFNDALYVKLYNGDDSTTYLVTNLPKGELEEIDFDIHSYSTNGEYRLYVTGNGDVVSENNGRVNKWKQKAGTEIFAGNGSEFIVVENGKCRKGSVIYEGDEFVYFDDRVWYIRDGHLYCEDNDTGVVGTRLRYAHGNLWLRVTSRCV